MVKNKILFVFAWIALFTIVIFQSTYAKAAAKIAIINMDSLFQEIAEKTGVPNLLEKEFRGRAHELQDMEGDLQKKIDKLQRYGSTMKANDLSNLEKDVMYQRQTLSKKAKAFEHDRAVRSSEERSKLVTRIQSAVQKVAVDNNIDLVVDVNAVVFNSIDIKNITADVMKQVK